MGKYMRKAKAADDDLTHHHHHLSSLGVRTRARTLALRRLHGRHPPPDSTSYLQLRTRRLPKPLVISPPSPAGSDPACREPSSTGKPPSCQSNNACYGNPNLEASLGENVPEVESVDRNLRETTPCSSILKSGMSLTPGSATRSAGSYSNKRIRDVEIRSFPSAAELEQFFGAEEQLQLRQFEEKYNFDPVNDCPMSGRYSWTRLE